MKRTRKFIKIKNWSQLTLGLLIRKAKTRTKDIARDKKFPIKVSLDINEWVVKAEPNGNIILFAPIIK